MDVVLVDGELVCTVSTRDVYMPAWATMDYALTSPEACACDACFEYTCEMFRMCRYMYVIAADAGYIRTPE